MQPRHTAYMPDAFEPRRRWFQFGLGPMLVTFTLLVALLGWGMWEVRLVHERQRLRVYINEMGGFTLHYGMTNEMPIIRHVHPVRVPRWSLSFPKSASARARPRTSRQYSPNRT